jgi:branched-chain amino acid transport system substrate-binding protein
MIIKWSHTALAAMLTIVSLCCLAENGVTGKSILIGRTAGITGPVAGAAKELGDGAQAYFDSVNAKGGVNGLQIKMVTLDDKFDPKIAAANAEALIKKEKVFALFLTRGTPHNEAILPLLAQSNIPLVAPSTGGAIFHHPVNRLVFNVRAKYQTEVAKGVEYFYQTGIKKIALAYVDDAFGEDALAGFKVSMAERKLSTEHVVRFDRNKPNVDEVVRAIVEWDPPALIMASSGKTTLDIIATLRARGSRTQIMVMSNNSRETFAKELGGAGVGVVVSQITPPPRMLSSALGKEFNVAAKDAGIKYSYAAMEGFIAAKVLVEGLRRAGPKLTREGFIDALESMRKFDLGGILIGYTPNDHTGSEYVDLTMIGRGGQILN